MKSITKISIISLMMFVFSGIIVSAADMKEFAHTETVLLQNGYAYANDEYSMQQYYRTIGACDNNYAGLSVYVLDANKKDIKHNSILGVGTVEVEYRSSSYINHWHKAGSAIYK